MSEPPPRPLAIRASRRRNDQTSNMPYRPSLGSQKLSRISRGRRGKSPGGYALPRSSTSTLSPAVARRCAVAPPPKPEPTTTASKRSSDIGVPELPEEEAPEARQGRRRLGRPGGVGGPHG